jgi:hypothetical protein
VTVPWSVAVDCAHSGAARTSIAKVAERDRNVFFGIRDSSLTGKDAAGTGWTSGAPMLARGVPGTKRLDLLAKANPTKSLRPSMTLAQFITYDAIRPDESESLDWSDLRGRR